MKRLPKPMRRMRRRQAGVNVVMLLILAKIAQVFIFAVVRGLVR